MGRGNRLKKQAEKAEARRLRVNTAKYHFDLLCAAGYEVFDVSFIRRFAHSALSVAPYPYDKAFRGQCDGGALRYLGDYRHGHVVEDRGHKVLVRSEYHHRAAENDLWKSPPEPVVVPGPLLPQILEHERKQVVVARDELAAPLRGRTSAMAQFDDVQIIDEPQEMRRILPAEEEKVLGAAHFAERIAAHREEGPPALFTPTGDYPDFEELREARLCTGDKGAEEG